MAEAGKVKAVSQSPKHEFSKQNGQAIELIAGFGIKGDAHAGKTVQHLSRIAKNPETPNLRQVHLIHAELIDELNNKGYQLTPGLMGENITTSGLDVLGLSEGTRLRLGDDAEIEITGLRNPCDQLNKLRDGLMYELIEKAADSSLIRKAGIMAIVLKGGTVRPGDEINIIHQPQPHKPLQAV